MRKLAILILTISLLVITGQPAAATSWVEDFCGHSSMVEVEANIQDGVINFGVADPSVVSGLDFHRGSEGFNLSPELDTDALNIFLYQAVNTDSAHAFDQVRINFNTEDYGWITSWGYFTMGNSAVVFVDENGSAVDATNNLGDSDDDPPPPIVETGAPPSGFQADGNGVVPFVHGSPWEPLAVTRDNTSITFDLWTDVALDQTTTIFGFTCNDPYIGWDEGALRNGTSATNLVPSPAPEPSSLVLICFGLLGLVGIMKRR